MSESVIRACSKLLPSRHRCRQLEEREGRCKKLASLLSSLLRHLRGPWCDTYYLKIATTHFAVCSAADIERRRQIGVVDEGKLGWRRARIRAVLEGSASPRPLRRFFPSELLVDPGRSSPLAFYHLVHDKIHRCFPFAVGRGKEKWTKALACTRSRVGRAFLFRRSTLLLFSNRWWTEDKRGEREREIGREKARGEETGAPPSNPLLDSSPALDCSIATTRGMLSTTATKCAEEIPMLSSPLTPSPLAPSPPTDGPALFTRCTRGSLAFAAITTDHHFSMD